MTHLRIIQNTGATEEVSSSVILKLYELATSGDLDNTSVLLGRINASIVKDTHLDYFMPLSGTKPYPEFYVSGTSIAVTFADPEVERVLITKNVGDSNGITQALLSALSYIGDEWFRNNTTVTQFNELSKCSNNNTIGTLCFLGCTNLTSVDLSKTQTIKPSAFRNCSKLTSIGSLQQCTSIQNMAFVNTKISSVDLSNVTTLQYLAFDGCTSLSTVTLPSTLTSLPLGCFKGCTSLSTIDLSNMISIDGSNDNYGTFQGCTSLTSVNLSNCTSLGRAIFRECTGLTTIDLSNCTTIGNRAFHGCTGLATVTLSNSLTTIPNHCFSGDTALTTINGGTGITTINEGAFSGCTALTTITGLSNITEVGTLGFLNCSSLTSIVLPNCTSVRLLAFDKCSNLEKIILPSIEHVYNFSAFTDLKQGCIIDLGPDLIDFGSVSMDTRVSALIFRKLGLVTVSGASSRGFFPTAYNSSHIYVPQAYINDYLADLYWGQLNSGVIVALEGSPYESTTWYLNVS